MKVTPVKTTADFKVLDESYQSPTIFTIIELQLELTDTGRLKNLLVRVIRLRLIHNGFLKAKLILNTTFFYEILYL